MKNSTLTHCTQQSLIYSPNLAVDYFTPIAEHPWAMLLRSASTQHSDSRFDILVAQPIVKVISFADHTQVLDPQGKSIHHADPFTLLHQLQQDYLPNLAIADQTLNELPFIGGALGYWSYDLARQIENLPHLAQQDIDLPDMAVGLYEWALVVDHQKQQAHLVGQNIEQAWHFLNQHQAQHPIRTAFKLTSHWQSNMTQESYQQKYAQIQAYLAAGDCYQINLAQRFHAHYQGDEWQAYLALEAANQAPFSAFLRIEQGAILSVSPERFLQSRQGQIETKPIKGTRQRSQDPQQDAALALELSCADKDQSENLMIVDLLRNDIGRVAQIGSVKVPKLFEIESFPAVHHLVSTIKAQLADQYQVYDLLRACFPGGSITGAPKVRAMQIIEELEPHRRSVYCGAIGYISRHGVMDTNISIRTLVAQNSLLYAWAGGGIVAQSQWQAEYQETLDKLSRILPVLSQLGSSEGKPDA